MILKNNDVPMLKGEPLYIPFVGAIIERITSQGKKEILIQTREKVSDSKYTGSLEIPGGKLKAFEDVYETLRREVREETGLEIQFIQKENNRSDYLNREDVSTLIEPFCVTQMKSGPFIGMIFLCTATGKPAKKTDETKNVRWIAIEELKEIVKMNPESIYTAFLGPLKKYLYT